MAAAPQIKIFDATGKYQASAHDYAAAACLMGLYGDGATIRLGHSKKETVWTQGIDGDATENYDCIYDAIYEWKRSQMDKHRELYGI